jgi:hypothetical protein
LIFSFYVRYSTLLHLPLLRFHCVGGCWDRTQECCDVVDSQLTTRPDLMYDICTVLRPGKARLTVKISPLCIVIVWCNIPSWQSCGTVLPWLTQHCSSTAAAHVWFHSGQPQHSIYYPDLQGIIFPWFISFWISLSRYTVCNPIL